MRIAQLTTSWRLNGGIATHVHLSSRALAAAGHDVLIVHHDPTPGEPSPNPHMTVVNVPDAFRTASTAGARAGGPVVMAALAAFAPDVVHCHGTNNFPLEDEIRRRYPTTKTLHVYDFCPSGTKYHHVPGCACTVGTSVMCLPRQVFNRCTLSKRPQVIWNGYRYAVTSNRHHQQFDPILVASAFVKREAVRTGFRDDRVGVLPYFTTMPAFVPASGDREVLFVGRLMREKGADLLIDALASIRSPWRAVVVGDGRELAAIRKRAVDAGVADRVQFPGWLTGDALADAYRRAAVVVMPSRWPEPFGITGIEALSHGRPVVAFGVGGIPEWLDDGESGWVAPPLDWRVLADRIQWLLDRPGDAAAMGARGRARVERDFTAPQHLARLMPIYERARH